MAELYHGHDHDHDHDHDPSDVDTQKVLIAKAVTMVVLCSVSTIMGIFPMQLAKWLKWNTTGNIQNPRSTQVVGLLLGFGGGILFCTTFLHMIPEVSEGVENLMSTEKLPNLTFSLAEMLTCCGFFIMYLVEESVHTHLRNRKSKKEQNIKKDVNRSTNELVEEGQTVTNGHSHTNGHGHSHHIPEIMDIEDDFVISSLRGLLIVLGLSVHELFEGLAIGLESSASYVWYMFAAVAAHKFVIAFCIGVELTAAKTRRYLSIIYVCTFAIVSPLGIGIGMILVGGESAAASGPLAVILQGLASGTLLYVVFFEILQEHRTGLRQYLSILVGFLVMFGLQMLININVGGLAPVLWVKVGSRCSSRNTLDCIYDRIQFETISKYILTICAIISEKEGNKRCYFGSVLQTWMRSEQNVDIKNITTKRLDIRRTEKNSSSSSIYYHM
ncbi:hypothetical protein M0804_001418 [Polistes exclamans]|nr:hypothetical protein M0804_001418 [Polistes exclamans]